MSLDRCIELMQRQIQIIQVFLCLFQTILIGILDIIDSGKHGIDLEQFALIGDDLWIHHLRKCLEDRNRMMIQGNPAVFFILSFPFAQPAGQTQFSQKESCKSSEIISGRDIPVFSLCDHDFFIVTGQIIFHRINHFCLTDGVNRFSTACIP